MSFIPSINGAVNKPDEERSEFLTERSIPGYKGIIT
jgi:hypothetical protein